MIKKNIKSALIVLNGDLAHLDSISLLSTEEILVVACDGGVKNCSENGLIPDVIIGDFDSYESSYLSKDVIDEHQIDFIAFSADKDQTDAELGLDYILSLHIPSATIIGFLGSRIDHMLGNLFLLRQPKYDSIDLKIIEGRQSVYVIKGDAVIHGHPGETVSLMPISGECQVSFCSGLQYDLSQYEIAQLKNPGISNIFTNKIARLKITSGELLVIHSQS
jgi:thiamine pyrophosphokinase